MKVVTGVLLVGLCVAAAPASAQRNRDNKAPLDRACGVADCFSEREIRDFEVVDETHVIVYVGSQRCAFHIEVRGTACDLTFAPELYFTRVNELPDGPLGTGPASNRGLADPFDPLEVQRRGRGNLKICGNDLSVQVHGGRFTETVGSNRSPDRFGNPRTDCRVTTVRSITDDELIEFYIDHEVTPPLPPIGQGEIEVGEQDEASTDNTP